MCLRARLTLPYKLVIKRLTLFANSDKDKFFFRYRCGRLYSAALLAASAAYLNFVYLSGVTLLGSVFFGGVLGSGSFTRPALEPLPAAS